MQQTFLITGLTCLIAAIAGGGLKAFGIEIPLLRSQTRQTVLGLLGLILIAISTFPYLFQEDSSIYEDKVPDTNSQGMRFLGLVARSTHNPTKVNDRIWVEFTLQNDSNEPIKLLGTYVTAYDPAERQRDFGFSHKDVTIMPYERIVTSGSLIVDVPGIWEFGPHYALGTKWDLAQYPGHWKRFQLSVLQ